MTAVFSPTDALRHDRHLSRDDSQFDYSSATTDWRAKYHEVVDMLAETRNELEEFQATSKELEAELEADLLRSDKQEKELKAKAEKAESERDEWKSKYMSLQTTHNSTTTSLQRELDQLRQEHQRIKVELRDLELGADDLERSKRATSSSLVDMEAKYTKTLEEKIILEHELLEKASLEEEMQRVRDELRDSQDEVSILREQLATRIRQTNIWPSLSSTSEDDLLHSSLPSELQLSELSSIKEPAFATVTTPKATAAAKASGQNLLLQRAGFNPNRPTGLPSPVSGITRSTTLPSLSMARNPIARAPTIQASSSASSTARNKGVQMVSEMRAKVRNLEQKIHTRVPRIRMGSITGRANAATSPINALGSSSSSSSGSLASTAKTSLDSIRRSIDSRKSHEKNGAKDTGDSSGWVLIMEDSPSPQKQRERERQKERRRVSSPSGPSVYRSGITAPSPTFNKSSGIGVRRPASRLSGASLSTATTGSSLPTPTSRPSTPTFLPLPSSTMSPGAAMKRSTAGVHPVAGNAKRTSLGTTSNGSFAESFRDRSSTISSPRPGPSTPSSINPSRSYKYDEMKSLPYLPTQFNPTSSVTSPRQSSRIGRPAGTGPRRSGGTVSDSGEALDVKDLRPRYAS
ncbi:hypothetical protein AGABI1DRAFT_117260 [Agaricus bisporus var. burnettii JB137-S8]|uniref:NUDE domain-containing protein n=1 Tax=Agaricus bisporus var. burnettii (strain JB137-S8 / ATCC MYA-4627 / FGSC 10392) TaxID=597362 RepID=K5Y6I5_AGABU|nr:uncharacterized protein AGABI1DRAFT_117260 [Agaricus bisporus var. burnettii JB137-S8]EKM83785.1 hypothetical protein AGABI1DRAFT_117260 [Agaricus bisporus var. burnettii JB137-S8]